MLIVLAQVQVTQVYFWVGLLVTFKKCTRKSDGKPHFVQSSFFLNLPLTIFILYEDNI